MKICVVAYKFGTEQEIGEHLGTYHYFIEKMRTLSKLGHEVHVIAPWLNFFHKGSQSFDGIKIIRYYPPFINRPKLLFINSLLRAWYFRATQRQVLRLDETIKPDVFYVWQARETGHAVAQIKQKLHAPFLFRQITAWQWHFDRSAAEIFQNRIWYKFVAKLQLQFILNKFLELVLDRQLHQKFAKEIYSAADKVVFVSRAATAEARALGLAENKIEIIGVGIEPELFALGGKEEWRKILSIEGSKVILFIGRINFAEKGIGYLLGALPEIIQSIPEANLVIIGGGGESARMNEHIKQLQIANHVQVVGKKPFTDLPKYLSASDVMVMPSVWVEHFGQVTIEAMAAGVPVVTTDVGGSPEINLHRQTGLVVPAKNSGAIAEAVIRILSDANLHKQFSENARRRVQENYTYEILVNKFLAVVSAARQLWVK